MAARTDFQPNVAPTPNPDIYTMHQSDDGITGQIKYPTTGTTNAWRAGEWVAGHVETLDVAEGETWPPVYT